MAAPFILNIGWPDSTSCTRGCTHINARDYAPVYAHIYTRAYAHAYTHVHTHVPSARFMSVCKYNLDFHIGATS